MLIEKEVVEPNKQSISGKILGLFVLSLLIIPGLIIAFYLFAIFPETFGIILTGALVGPLFWFLFFGLTGLLEKWEVVSEELTNLVKPIFNPYVGIPIFTIGSMIWAYLRF